MISVAALVILISGVAMVEGVLGAVRSADPVQAFAGCFCAFFGSLLFIVAVGWWVWGDPPMLLPDHAVERLACLWTVLGCHDGR